MSKAILFLNGNIDIAFCQSYIQNNNISGLVYCTDGAYSKVRVSEFIAQKIDKVVGDFDSIVYYDSPLFHLDTNQDNTDFEKALEYMMTKDINEIMIFGASGGEMDHFLSNMSIAKKYRNKLRLTFVDEYSKYFFISRKYTVENVKNKMLSVIPFPFATNIYYKGLEYNLAGGNLILGENTGSRNFAVKDNVDIEYETGDVILFISHENYK